MDIQSLYTCIPHVDGLKVLCFFLSRRPNQSPSTDTLICPTELILTLNNFSFSSFHFLQTKEEAMGNCIGPSYACLFVGYVEQFTWIISDTSLSFPDLSVSIFGYRLKIGIYFKLSDSHSYLDYTSSHPPSCKNVIPYSLFLCLRRICSQDGAFHIRTSQMSSFKD
eukprot:g24641.t1